MQISPVIGCGFCFVAQGSCVIIPVSSVCQKSLRPMGHRIYLKHSVPPIERVPPSLTLSVRWSAAGLEVQEIKQTKFVWTLTYGEALYALFLLFKSFGSFCDKVYWSNLEKDDKQGHYHIITQWWGKDDKKSKLSVKLTSTTRLCVYFCVWRLLMGRFTVQSIILQLIIYT